VDFDKLLRRHDAKADVSPIQSFGERIDRVSSVFVELTPGRHAALSKRDSQADFEIALQKVGSCFYEHELELVADFVGVPLEYVERYANPPIRWVSSSPTDAELQYWVSRVGVPYPYLRR
jgi:hypothetical protein